MLLLVFVRQDIMNSLTYKRDNNKKTKHERCKTSGLSLWMAVPTQQCNQSDEQNSNTRTVIVGQCPSHDTRSNSIRML